MRCGLLGKKLGHSYSPMIHNLLANYTYELFEREPEELEAFLRFEDFTGCNVTIPYKKAVIPFCTELSAIARKLGAVNTLVRTSDGKVIGHNTDYFGFSYLCKKSGLSVTGKKVLVLGTGGASATVCAVLREAQAQVVTISRTGPDNYQNLYRHVDASVIVNATPVGMYPNTYETPLDLKGFPKLEGVLDLIYNPCRTRLLMDAEKMGCVTANGLWMLVAQAKESAEWFLKQPISDSVIPKIYQRIRKEAESIILIGMPGCGKSTIGKLLAQKTGRTFVDTDEVIEKRVGLTISEIFTRYGEPEFRKMEHEVLKDFGKRPGLVLATGGGCVKNLENYSLLHQNGSIFWLQRDLHQLATERRPLSQQNTLQQLYAQRKPMYEAFCDRTVVNRETPEDTVADILAMEDMG